LDVQISAIILRKLNKKNEKGVFFWSVVRRSIQLSYGCK